jgi:uncharacterized repeat protein (TIGR04076 family)
VRQPVNQKDRQGICDLNRIRCEAITVNADSGICPGIAKTKQGEVFTIGGRTPEPNGICCQAFSAIEPMKLAMMLTDKMDWETKGYFDIVCPHGFVTYRLSRIRER